jgi:hypothetical protein
VAPETRPGSAVSEILPPPPADAPAHDDLPACPGCGNRRELKGPGARICEVCRARYRRVISEAIEVYWERLLV